MNNETKTSYAKAALSRVEPIWIVAGFVSIALSVYIVLATKWAHISLDGVTSDGVAARLFGLFVIALAIERVTEVAVQIFYGQDKRALTSQAKYLSAPIDAKIRAVKAASPSTTAEFDAMTKTITEIESSLDANSVKMHKKNSDHIHRKCQRLALAVGVFFGFFLSLAGLRILEALLGGNGFSTMSDTQNDVLEVIDIFITAALLAGGSDGIHQIITTAGKIGKDPSAIES
ncbi:MAG: hypothetical protein AAFQ24_03605 [Pseudomonadota bacterium]